MTMVLQGKYKLVAMYENLTTLKQMKKMNSNTKNTYRERSLNHSKSTSSDKKRKNFLFTESLMIELEMKSINNVKFYSIHLPFYCTLTFQLLKRQIRLL